MLGHDETMGIEIVKCRGPVIRAGRPPVDKAVLDAVMNALKERPMTFRELLGETKLNAIDVTDALRLMTDESVSKGISKSGVVFQYASEPEE